VTEDNIPAAADAKSKA